MKVYVQIEERRVFMVTLEAPSLEAGKDRAVELFKANELTADYRDFEAISVRHPSEKAT